MHYLLLDLLVIKNKQHQDKSTFYIFYIFLKCLHVYQIYILFQIELFGRKFEPGEFDRMPPSEQQDKSDKMMSLIQRWREERRAAELRGK